MKGGYITMKHINLEQDILNMIITEMNLNDTMEEEKLHSFSYDAPIFSEPDEDGLGLDSMDALELIVILQTNFDFIIEDKDVKRLTTIHNIAEYVREKK